jgi:hypothetical protein
MTDHYYYLVLFMCTSYKIWIVFSPLCCCCVFVVSVLVECRYLGWGVLAAGQLEGGDESLSLLYFISEKLCSRTHALICNTRVGGFCLLIHVYFDLRFLESLFIFFQRCWGLNLFHNYKNLWIIPVLIYDLCFIK